jgi:glycosyltransferase involved in cell wall biosynthesis
MLVSVIIRTRNEAQWIRQCLFAVASQSFEKFEIILVDNESTDSTMEIARSFGVKEVKISQAEFSYGRALNLGIEAATGKFIAIISGHCIPFDNYWMAKHLANFQDLVVAGVYGRQEPLPETGDFDKRDLWTTFGIERRIQKKDYFFHNANSMIRRSVWEKYPFDEQLNGLEDRHWAKQVISDGYSIVYEPAASVYHHHGIHQGRDESRARRIVKVIEMNLNDKGEEN